MVYVTGTPLAGEAPSVSQPKIQTNFTELNTQLSVEHDKLVVGGATGKHKYITLSQNPGDPVPIGNDISLRNGSSAGKWSLETRDSANVYRHVPLRSVSTFVTAAGAHSQNVLDFSTLGFGVAPATTDWTSGTIHVYPITGNYDRQWFTMFTWNPTGPHLYIAHNADSQLFYNGVGSSMGRLNNSGTWLVVETQGGWAADTIRIIVTTSRG